MAKDKVVALRARKLEACEQRIGQALGAYQATALALLEIHDEDLWVEDYDGFDQYCEQRWELRKSHAYRLLNDGRFLRALAQSPTRGLEPPAVEAHVRPLMRVKAWEKDNDQWGRPVVNQEASWERRVEAWRIVRDRALADEQPITTAFVHAVIEHEYRLPAKKVAPPPTARQVLERACRKIVGIAEALAPEELVEEFGDPVDWDANVDRAREYLEALFAAPGTGIEP